MTIVAKSFILDVWLGSEWAFRVTLPWSRAADFASVSIFLIWNFHLKVNLKIFLKIFAFRNVYRQKLNREYKLAGNVLYNKNVWIYFNIRSACKCNLLLCNFILHQHEKSLKGSQLRDETHCDLRNFSSATPSFVTRGSWEQHRYALPCLATIFEEL